VMEKRPKNPDRTRLALQFFYWAFLKGDEMAADTGFVALPTNMQAKVISSFQGVRDKSGDPLQILGTSQTYLAGL